MQKRSYLSTLKGQTFSRPSQMVARLSRQTWRKTFGLREQLVHRRAPLTIPDFLGHRVAHALVLVRGYRPRIGSLRLRQDRGPGHDRRNRLSYSFLAAPISTGFLSL